MSGPPPKDPAAEPVSDAVSSDTAEPASGEGAPSSEAAGEARGAWAEPSLLGAPPPPAPAVPALPSPPSPAIPASPSEPPPSPVISASLPARTDALQAASVEASPPPARSSAWVANALAAANIAVWVITVALGASVISPSAQWLADHGANLGPITLDGEEWRLFTSMFLHVGVLHLAMNMIGLVTGGKVVEQWFGHLGFAVIYLLSGLAGSLASALRSEPAVSAGASGAIFGVLGAVGAYYVLHRGRMDLRSSRDATGLIVVVAYNAVIGFTQSGIDMYAHLGGLAAGFVVGLAIELGRSGPRVPRALAVGAVGLAVMVAAAFAASAPGAGEQRALQAFTTVEKQVLARWKELAGQLDAASITPERLADAIEQEILPPWRDAVQAFDLRGGGPHRQTLLEYMRLRQQGWELLAEALRTDDDARMTRALARFQEAQELLNKLSE